MKKQFSFLAILLSIHCLWIQPLVYANEVKDKRLQTGDNRLDKTENINSPIIILNVTVSQYCDFLNAVAASDPHHLGDRLGGGERRKSKLILRTGSSEHYHYEVVPGCKNLPITNINWFDQVRFCNWMENGQPIGLQGPETTEDGVYTLNEDEVVAVNNESIYSLTTNEENSPIGISIVIRFADASHDPQLCMNSSGSKEIDAIVARVMKNMDNSLSETRASSINQTTQAAQTARISTAATSNSAFASPKKTTVQANQSNQSNISNEATNDTLIVRTMGTITNILGNVTRYIGSIFNTRYLNLNIWRFFHYFFTPQLGNPVTQVQTTRVAAKTYSEIKKDIVKNQKKAIEAEAADKPEIAEQWSEVAKKQSEAAYLLIKASEEKDWYKRDCWNDASMNFSDAAENLEKAIEAEEAGKPEIAQKYREAAWSYTKSARAYAEGKYAQEKINECQSWNKIGNRLNKVAENLEKAIEAEKAGKPEVTQKYRDAAGYCTKSARAYAEGKTDEGYNWDNAAKYLEKA
ncbi:MAG TPA: hypothetical protein VJK54_09260, partial [Chthoniobacterales bacterium]|nr:hypothetical protein [Chthoniobacterales bacterium]